ncbi:MULTISPECIES: hypothetical protein [Streptomyces]|uniref:hypothetical protein n=1 Tax=Streptomyces TaxID=1883 RepID=UPI0006FD50DA|nr:MULTISPECIES: hypothetical protein [Streptomyces]KQX86120.1 hypothetical protein ASD26_26515 [Streptomyces sp. Root1319]KQZ17155.1 hypothetical protein ASD51_05380 [Streptomyces sp. Root55]RPK83911.1 hypothetical protein EES45_05615 [Streptomyces sp. ADI97-07]WRY85163.1 hypothetical protein OG388_29975 [Streptomyces clavifer]WUC30869.1 hypothetical protein OG927_27525 [Streptomyces clavifer]
MKKPSKGNAVRTVVRGAAVLGLVLAPAAPVTAASAGAPGAAPPGLSCDTGKHAAGDYTGYALCRNDGSSPRTFRVHLVCGWSPDVDGERVTLNPGQSGQSTAHCAGLGSGIGEIHVRP